MYDTGTELTESKPLREDAERTHGRGGLWEELKSRLTGDEVETVEAVVSPGCSLVHGTARELDLRQRYGVNLLAISRSNENLRTPLGTTPLKPGDVLLLQGHHERLPKALSSLGCLPLAEREINLEPRNLVLGVGIFSAALVTASLDVLSVPVAMTAAAAGMVIASSMSLHEAYRQIQWPIILLLGPILSMGVAMEQTGADQLIADQLLRASDFIPPVALLVIVMLGTMMLSDVVNNTAAVVLMASIAINVARGLRVSLEPFLVAVGGACAFLTPIGHEANVLVFDVGGYEFGDYWRLGLPLELLITAITVPLLLWIWPR